MGWDIPELVRVVSDLRANAWRVVSDGSCKPKPTLLTGNWSAAAAAAAACCWKLATCCRLCSKAVECSWAFRRSSATLDERCSELELESAPVNKLPPERGFTGQQEQRPGKPRTENIQNLQSRISAVRINFLNKITDSSKNYLNSRVYEIFFIV